MQLVLGRLSVSDADDVPTQGKAREVTLGKTKDWAILRSSGGGK